ncbi:MAG: nucleotidyltransferase family protein [Clostridia bacterium]|nr:nucleotidyltransferase family protein [Clostridia bacterium]
MSTFGIVCEWNPFHNGHARLLSEARRLGADRIVCVMSGCAVQRGELAVADPYARAEAALRCGADLVLQLPYPWSAAGADYFAEAAVTVLEDYADVLLFGSECGEIDRLWETARIAEHPQTQAAFAEALKRGERAAQAYGGLLGTELSSNDLLGVAYLRVLLRHSCAMTACTVRRVGDAYRSEGRSESDYPSATAIRRLWQSGQWAQTISGMPGEAETMFRRLRDGGELTDPERLDTAILTFFRLRSASDFEGIAEAGGGIAERICSLAQECTTAKELFEALRTKQYTDAHLRRAMLFCMTGVKESLLHQTPAYTLLLGATEGGRALLSQRRKQKKRVPLITKPADLPRECEQFEAEAALQAMFSLAKGHPSSAGAWLKKSAVFLGEKENT